MSVNASHRLRPLCQATIDTISEQRPIGLRTGPISDPIGPDQAFSFVPVHSSNAMQSDRMDTYWRLMSRKISPDLYRAYLRRRASDQHLVPGPEMSEQQYGEHWYRYQHHRVLYRACSVGELKRLAQNRGLEIPPSCQQNHVRKGRARLAWFLHDADFYISFHPFMDLPPDLRLVVYEHYFAAFASTLTYPSQPALARVSRQLRLEVLSAFYRQCRFRITFESDNARPPFRATLATHAFLSTISEANLGKICNIQLDVGKFPWRSEGSVVVRKTGARWFITTMNFDAEKTEAVDSAVKAVADGMCDGDGKVRALPRDFIYRFRDAMERGWGNG
ncbi:hypothetical protein AC578_8873 [Pseudocercospora eumusae]|uniref:Uncharacterized protein n=1 Tax=Pseudocercospora eumusae TaxID=321146 RepID=A0A139HBM5_9PEZI|nr:hypothetical protein AC578_8873 [Pseudocercospora eumusae]